MNAREQLALWYLRLNGYFTMPNFIAHAHNGSRTDVDVLAVRFPHSTEYPDDVKRLGIPQSKIDIVFAEAKTGLCELNGPWRGKSQKLPLEYVLKRVGISDDQSVLDNVAHELYTRRRFPPGTESHKWAFTVRLVCFGSSQNKHLPDVTQILWPDVISFIGERFQRYRDEKADHQHWDSFGKYLWDKLSDNYLPSVQELMAEWQTRCPCWP